MVGKVGNDGESVSVGMCVFTDVRTLQIECEFLTCRAEFIMLVEEDGQRAEIDSDIELLVDGDADAGMCRCEAVPNIVRRGIEDRPNNPRMR